MVKRAAKAAIAPMAAPAVGAVAASQTKQIAQVSVTQPIVHTTINLDSRMIADVMQERISAQAEEKLVAKIPVWTPFGGR